MNRARRARPRAIGAETTKESSGLVAVAAVVAAEDAIVIELSPLPAIRHRAKWTAIEIRTNTAVTSANHARSNPSTMTTKTNMTSTCPTCMATTRRTARTQRSAIAVFPPGTRRLASSSP